MRGDDLAPLFRQAPDSLGFRQGVVISWDPLTGSNQIDVGGTLVDDLPTLAASTIALAEGDVVGLIRFKSTYFITGRIAPAGGGALSMRAARVAVVEGTSSLTWTDLATPGPTVTATIGASRQCLVIASCNISITTSTQAVAAAQVTGASSIDPDALTPCGLGYSGANTVQVSSSAVTMLTAADGLNAGVNTFTLKYRRSFPTSGGQNANFSGRGLTIIPY